MPCEINQISNDKHLGKINSESLNAAELVTCIALQRELIWNET